MWGVKHVGKVISCLVTKGTTEWQDEIVVNKDES
jgi:hypothetical protein